MQLVVCVMLGLGVSSTVVVAIMAMSPVIWKMVRTRATLMNMLNSWSQDGFSYIGRYVGFPRKKMKKVLFLGLNNAGKTTLLFTLRDERPPTSVSQTLRPNIEDITFENFRFRAFDLAGCETLRGMWQDYMFIADGIAFFVDAADPARFHEARQEFQKFLRKLCNHRNAAAIPIVVLGSKSDLPTAATEHELLNHMFGGLDEAKLRSFGPMELFMVDFEKLTGHIEAFKWLTHCIRQGKRGQRGRDVWSRVHEARMPEIVVQLRGTLHHRAVRVACTSVAGDDLKTLDMDVSMTWNEARRLLVDSDLCPGFRAVFLSAGLVLAEEDGSKTVGEILTFDVEASLRERCKVLQPR